jgi:hypothetical protein
MNSASSGKVQAEAAFKSARKDYLNCEGPAAVGENAMTEAQATIDGVVTKAVQLQEMNEMLLTQLQRELGAEQAIGSLTGVARGNVNDMQSEIDRLQSIIRTQRRRFLDADPSVTPAVAGMYFTKVPDNKVLIAFLVCYGAFLLFTSILILMNQVPLPYFMAMASGEKVKVVGLLWVVALVLGYVGFFMFT